MVYDKVQMSTPTQQTCAFKDDHQRYNQTWITRDIKRISRTKERAFKKYRKSKSNREYEKYQNLKIQDARPM
jgi:hypothetical protein